MNKLIITIVVSIFIGGFAGYWYRGQVLLTQEQMTAAAVMSAPPQVVKMAPGGDAPPQ